MIIKCGFMLHLYRRVCVLFQVSFSLFCCRQQDSDFFVSKNESESEINALKKNDRNFPKH